MLVTMHGAQTAWLEARDRRRASTTGDQQDGEARRRETRHWNAVMREIERQTGYRHQPDTATRYLDR
ncbi:hypothetical protein VQ042_19430 [Aurantimonas sp. A2-1-M11]|uniref:hypothetical protein n=1 Tax=Aurantimonas sp. A2-1-M11 TaxID=3113712 RepID=UPI002F955476